MNGFGYPEQDEVEEAPKDAKGGGEEAAVDASAAVEDASEAPPAKKQKTSSASGSSCGGGEALGFGVSHSSSAPREGGRLPSASLPPLRRAGCRGGSKGAPSRRLTPCYNIFW